MPANIYISKSPMQLAKWQHIISLRILKLFSISILSIRPLGLLLNKLFNNLAVLNIHRLKLARCYGINLTHTIAHYSMLFPTIGWPTTSALAANLVYLYTLPLCTFFSSLYHNVVIQSTLL